MEPLVDLAPGADHDPLARRLAELVRQTVERERPRRDFERLRGTVGIVVDDTNTALTLRFDFGRLTIHEGLVGVPTVTIRGRQSDIEALSELSLGAGVREVFERRHAALALVGALRGGRLKIYGLVSHARFVARLLRVLGARADREK